jgi:hypothetical protein
VLAGITQALGAERINIEDFELQHMSRERGGTLTVLVAARTRPRARGRLEAQGYHVVVVARLGRMKVEPAGRSSVTSPSRRQVDLAPRGPDRALCDGETRVRGFGRSGDTQSTIDAVRTLGVRSGRSRRRRARRTCGAGSTPRRRDCGKRRHADAAAAGILAGNPAAGSSPATSHCAPARWTASPSRSTAWAHA